ncbi:kinase-like domain-containing protein [Glomus cerebriforme]|uniref:Kinase-like domain-containing protein n=1 Tax=Glomus cerebriforme TaxID=658196 RepID=A0A397SF75_9GLOM|nr:kinase-like domain-containing protein [Glomus cerebriforme]
MWEITCLLNGAQASKVLMMQFTKSDNNIQEDRSQKRIIRGSRKHVIRKILKSTREDVAEKEIGIFNPREDETERQFWSEVAIADYLKDCKYILKFRGIIERNGKRHTIFEWAKHEDLQTYLLTHPDLPWSFKIKVAWEVASALSHCHEKGILHHDVRSHNVMLGENYIAQLTNFETSRPQSGSFSWPVKDTDEVLRWTAPEKTSPEVRYTVENDVYSFGILMWEIASQQRPFADIKSGLKVFEKVSNGERPDTNMFKNETSHLYINEFLKIMNEAWRQEPSQRPEMTSICEHIRDLHLRYKDDDFTTLQILPMSSLSLNDLETQDAASEETPYQNEENKNADELNLEKAQQHHEAKNYTAAWSIYDALAKNGNAEAKFKAGFYLANGPPYYPRKDLTKAENYVREAADDGHVDAQYRYFQLLFKKAKNSQNKHKLIIAEGYLKSAVDKDYANALYTYGEHLFKGTFGFKDPEKGHQLLMAAHYRMHEKALERLKKLEELEELAHHGQLHTDITLN